MKVRIEELEIDAKGRVLIPAYFRDRLDLKTGDKVNIELEMEKDDS